MMEGIDTQWCLGCDSHYSTTETEPYCSADCFLKHQQEADRPSAFYRTPVPPSPQPIPMHHTRRRQQPSRTPSSSSFRSESFSELDLCASYRPSPSYPYAASAHSQRSHHSSGSSSSKADAWVGKGAEGIPAWVATVPYGFSPNEPSSSTTFSSHHSRRSSTSSSSVTPPSRPRTRASMSSTLSTPQSLRPAALDLSARKPAPPRLDRFSNVPRIERATSHGSTTISVSSPPTPTIHSKSIATITPYTSLPSLARSSASASLTSIATPGSLLQANSRPVTPPESELGDAVHPSIFFTESEVGEKHLQQQQRVTGEQQGQKKSKGQGMFQNLAMHLKAWAASNAHAESCIPQYPQPPPQHSRGRVAAGVMAPAPAKQESQLESSERVPRPAQEIPRPAAHKNRWLKEAVYFNDEDFAYGFGGSGQGVGSSVRMGRGLVSAKKATVGGVEREEKAQKEKKAVKSLAAPVPVRYWKI